MSILTIFLLLFSTPPCYNVSVEDGLKRGLLHHSLSFPLSSTLYWASLITPVLFFLRERSIIYFGNIYLSVVLVNSIFCDILFIRVFGLCGFNINLFGLCVFRYTFIVRPDLRNTFRNMAGFRNIRMLTHYNVKQ